MDRIASMLSDISARLRTLEERDCQAGAQGMGPLQPLPPPPRQPFAQYHPTSNPSRPQTNIIPLMSIDTGLDRDTRDTTGAQTLVKIVQLRHHQLNWQRLPKSISQKINNFAGDLNPPMKNEEFKLRLTELTTSFGESICQLVQSHLQTALESQQREAGRLNPTDLRQAEPVANHILLTKLGGKLNPDRRRTLLREAVETNVRPPQPINHPPPTNPQLILNKRKLPSLPDTESPTTSDDHHDPHPLEQPSAKKYKPAAVRELNMVDPSSLEGVIPTPQNSSGGIHIMYGGPKDSWHLDTPEYIHSIIIGDSNLRLVQDVPDGWMVVGMPGARLNHIRSAINNSFPPDRNGAISIIIQGGINHRGGTDRAEIKKQIEHTVHDLTAHRAFSVVRHLGISYPTTLDETHKNTIDYINQCFVELLGEDNCMPPLPPGMVSIVPNDKYGTHYTAATARAIFSRVYEWDFRTRGGPSPTF